MRKRHQALFISSEAKKNICNKLSINHSSYEIEQKKILEKYLKENIDEEDVEIPKEEKKFNDDEEEDSEEEESISLCSNIAVPPLGEQKGPYIRYEISEKAFVGGINFDDYYYIPENKIKIRGENDEEKKKFRSHRRNERNAKVQNDDKDDAENDKDIYLKVGASLNFNSIVEQMAYWAEELSKEKSKSSNKNKKKITNVEIPDINIFLLFKLYPNKIDEIDDKIKSLQKEARDKNIYTDNSAIKCLLNDQENIINEKKQNISKLSKELDRINTITYGENFSIIGFK